MSKTEDFYLHDIEFKSDIKSAPNGDFQLIKGKENLKQALYNRLVTVPGSLAHRPDYGIGIQSYIGKIGSLGNQRKLALSIQEQFLRDFRVDSVTSISFKQEDNGLFYVKYIVQAKGLGEIEQTVNPFGDIQV